MLFELVEEHVEVGADHAIAVFVGGDVVAAGRGVLRNLAEDPGVGGGGAADHDGIAAGGVGHGDGVFGGEDVAVADDRDGDGVFDTRRCTPSGPGRSNRPRGCGRGGRRR